MHILAFTSDPDIKRLNAVQCCLNYRVSAEEYWGWRSGDTGFENIEALRKAVDEAGEARCAPAAVTA